MKPRKTTKNQTPKPTTEKKTIAAKRSVAPTTSPVAAETRPVATAPAALTPPRQQKITTEAIAACAYALWEKDGRPCGRDEEYWLKAESELKQNAQSFAA